MDILWYNICINIMAAMPKRDGKTNFLFNQKFIAALGLVIIVLISLPLAKNLSRRYKINQEVKDLEREISELENKNSDLKNFVSYLESNQFAEEQARINLGLKKQGEKVVVVTDNSTAAANPTGTASDVIFNIPGLKKEEAPKPVTNPQKWYRYFFK